MTVTGPDLPKIGVSALKKSNSEFFAATALPAQPGGEKPFFKVKLTIGGRQNELTDFFGFQPLLTGPDL